MTTDTLKSAGTAYEEGLAQHKQGDLDEAEKAYDAALRLDPRHAAAWHMRGVIELQRGKHEAAVSAIRKSLAIFPGDASAHSNLATSLMVLRKFDEAIEAGRTAVKLKPDWAEAWSNLGMALSRRSRYPEALEAYQRASTLKPDRAGFHSMVGYCLGKLDRFDEALASHKRAIELAPDRPEFKNNMAKTLKDAGLGGEAEEMLRAAVAEGLSDQDVVASLGFLLQKRGKVADAVAAFDQANAGRDNVRLGKLTMFLKRYLNATTVAEQREQARETGRQIAAAVGRFTAYDNDPDPQRVLRVGLVSADLRNHSVGMFLIDFLPRLDPRQLELYAYSRKDPGDEYNLAFREMISNWRPTSEKSDDEVADMVRQDRIDILIDLSGPTGGSRLPLFARKPAPVSVTWLGHSGTTGLEEIDYVLGDAEVLPEGLDQTVEAPWRLPDVFLCFSPPRQAPAVAPLPSLANGHVTFGTFNNLSKVSEATLDAWARILDAVPGSRLVLKARSRDDANEDPGRMAHEFEKRGVAPDRITVHGWLHGRFEHLPLYGGIDIGLDPFPYNGTTTTCESLLMGVPVLALRGDRFVALVGVSLMKTIGLPDWVADDVDAYVAAAVEKARDLTALAALRAGLRDRLVGSPLCDAPRFARNFEAAMRQMWVRWCATRPAQSDTAP